MAKLHRDAHLVLRRVGEKIRDTSEILVIAFEAWRELQQDRTELLLQRSRACEKIIPRLSHIVEPLNVRDEARELEREDEIVGHRRIPVLVSGHARQMIEGVVDLGATKRLRI